MTIKGTVQHTGGKNPMKKANVDASAIMFYLPGKKSAPTMAGGNAVGINRARRTPTIHGRQLMRGFS